MRHAHMLVFDGLADWEVGLVTFELNTRNAIPVTTFGFTEEPIHTGGGLCVLPDLSLAEVEIDNISLLLLPGGSMWRNTFDPVLADLVLRLHRQGIPVAAICGATAFLAKAGLFREGVRHTSNSLDYLLNTVPEYKEQTYYQDTYAISDRNIITAGGAAPAEFTYQIMKTLGLFDADALAEFAEFWNCREMS